MHWVTLSVLAFCCFSYSEARATIQNNGYQDILVAISPDLPEDPAVIDNLKELLTYVSKGLYKATRQHVFFRSINILIPKSWSSIPDTEPATGQLFEDAEFRVDMENPAYRDNPYTKQNGECGKEGHFVHVTPWFVKNHKGDAATKYGRTDKVLVHEWSKLRYGVFEEYGYPGDKKFPMFYFQTQWTSDGQKSVLVPNFCTNTQILGESRDLTTGGSCKEDLSTGLPDYNCFFTAFQNNTVSSSYMAIPYLHSVSDFCDDYEVHFHDPELPNKHNLYCDGRSVWDVISSNKDLVDNPPVDDLDTKPQFRILRQDNTKYVIVMDASGSMDADGNQEGIPRGINMINAVKRWVKYEVKDGMEVGASIFKSEVNIRPPVIGMRVIDDQTREEIMEAVGEIEFSFRTCIGCGLYQALYHETLLNNSTGGVIILITDGAQNCQYPESPDCLTISDVVDDLVEHQVRVITMALGASADEEIESLAVRTGGISYYVNDADGPGSFNDAFMGSLTYQPGDTLANTDTVLYQQDWDLTVNPQSKLVGNFTVDMSVGRDVVFQLEVRTKDNSGACMLPLEVLLVAPDDQHTRTDFDFTCTKDNFGVLSHKFPQLLDIGRWLFKITLKETYSYVSVTVNTKSRTENTDPILTKCYISTGSQAIDTTVNVKLAVVAEVSQGSKPVIGAVVNAEVDRPPANDGTAYPPLNFKLKDDGSGADLIKDDGTYSKYFGKYTGKGRYSVRCAVEGGDGSSVNEGVPAWRNKVFPAEPGSPICCGSNGVSPGAELTKTGNFTRAAPGGSFSVSNDVDINDDNIPPCQVVDLVAEVTENDFGEEVVHVEFTAPGDDLDSEDSAASYTLKYSTTAGNLTKEHWDGDFNIDIAEADLDFDSDLSPVEGGSKKIINIDGTVFENNQKYFLAMKSLDEKGNPSRISNKASFFKKEYHPLVPTTTTTTTPPPMPDCPDNWKGIAGAGCYFFGWGCPGGCNRGQGIYYCQQVDPDAILAEIYTETQQASLVALAQKESAAYWWLGLERWTHANDDKWTWPRNNRTAEYFSWGPGYPETEKCAVLHPGASFLWKDEMCYMNDADGRYYKPLCFKPM